MYSFYLLMYAGEIAHNAVVNLFLAVIWEHIFLYQYVVQALHWLARICGARFFIRKLFPRLQHEIAALCACAGTKYTMYLLHFIDEFRAKPLSYIATQQRNFYLIHWTRSPFFCPNPRGF